MLKKLHVLNILIAFLVFTGSAIAQQTNFSEDYSTFLTEIRALNQRLIREPPPLPDSAPETQIKPSVKYIHGPGGDLALRIFKPDTIRAVVMDIHGGGWCSGIAAFDDRFNDEMARKCKVAVVSVEYRLAPEYPFPACMADCNAAAKWLVDHSMQEFGTGRLFISGGSAGGHLCALATLYIRDSLHAIDRVKGVNLMYGVFDLSRTPSSRMVTDTTPFINKMILEQTFELVLPGWSIEQKRNPRYSPLYADLHNLPPALFTVGTMDPMADDTYFMEAGWRLAGNKTFLAVYPECPHAFTTFPVKMGVIANEKIFNWIIAGCEK